METSIWAAVAMLYGIVPLTVFCGILYYAHYHSKAGWSRVLLYILGGAGTAGALGYLVYDNCFVLSVQKTNIPIRNPGRGCFFLYQVAFSSQAARSASTSSLLISLNISCRPPG